MTLQGFEYKTSGSDAMVNHRSTLVRIKDSKSVGGGHNHKNHIFAFYFSQRLLPHCTTTSFNSTAFQAITELHQFRVDWNHTFYSIFNNCKINSHHSTARTAKCTVREGERGKNCRQVPKRKITEEHKKWISEHPKIRQIKTQIRTLLNSQIPTGLQ